MAYDWQAHRGRQRLALRVANRPIIIQVVICMPCTSHTHDTILGTLAAKVALLSYCVGKAVESQRKSG